MPLKVYSGLFCRIQKNWSIKRSHLYTNCIFNWNVILIKIILDHIINMRQKSKESTHGHLGALEAAMKTLWWAMTLLCWNRLTKVFHSFKFFPIPYGRLAAALDGTPILNKSTSATGYVKILLYFVFAYGSISSGESFIAGLSMKLPSSTPPNRQLPLFKWPIWLLTPIIPTEPILPARKVLTEFCVRGRGHYGVLFSYFKVVRIPVANKEKL